MEIKAENVLYLVGGPNGSGKTTLVEKIFGPHPQIAFLNTDNMLRDLHIGKTTMVDFLFQEMDHMFAGHYSFVYETTLSDKFHHKLIRRAKDAGYSIEFFYVILNSVEQNLARVQERVINGGHNVPENTIRRRHKKSLFNFDTVYKQSDHWTLYDNAGDGYRLLATGAYENVNVVDSDLYNNFIKSKQNIISEYLTDLERRRAARIGSIKTALSK